MQFRMEGPDYTALAARLTAKSIAVEAVTHAGLTQAMEILSQGVQSELTLKSHSRHTPTPSAPGEPPAAITGALSKSVRVDGPRGAAGVYEATVGAATAYARIQQLGGRTGRGHAVTLPPRPYLQPAMRKAQAAILAVLVAAWRRAMEA